MTKNFEMARAFLHREARLLERRLFATLFDGASAVGVIDALRGFQNPDGGFGHGLEPDKRCPASLPVDVEFAFQTLAPVARDHREAAAPMVLRACDFLASAGDAAGAVPLAFPVIEGYPRAEHWTEWTYAPGLLPTAGLVGLLHRLGVEHPWRVKAAAFCWLTLEAAIPGEAHAFSEALVFLEHIPEQDRANALVPAVEKRLPHLTLYRADPEDPSYGVTPLHFAPTPDSPWRRLFADDLIDAHLDRLVRDQQPDGGWPLAWKPPSKASTQEWRGIETLRALRVLTAYGR